MTLHKATGQGALPGFEQPVLAGRVESGAATDAELKTVQFGEAQPDSWTQSAADYARLARGVATVSVVTTKDGRFWELVAWSLFLLSLGRFARRRFLEDFASTLGPVQAYPPGWTALSPRLIVHEARHTQQFLRAGWFVPIVGWLGPRLRVWAGLLPMGLVYGFFPLPVFFAWGRFRLELDADSYSWKVALENGWMSPDDVRERANSFAATISSWADLKTWPRRWAQRSFQCRAEEVIEAWRAWDNAQSTNRIRRPL